MSNINRIVFCIVFLLFPFVIFAESEGGALFRQNKPEEAIPILERDISAGTAEAEDYNFLGLSYYQTGDWEKSVAAFEAGLSASGTNKRILAFNAGNSCYGAGEFEKAEEYYSLAIIADSTFKEAILNRANAKFRQDKLAGAVEDYELFEMTAPDDENIPLVQEMVVLLKAEIRKREENARLEAELERRRREKDRELIENGEAPKDEDDAKDVDENTSEIIEDDGLPEPETPVADDSKESSSEIIDDDGIPETAAVDDEKANEDLQNVQPEIVADEIHESSVDAGADGTEVDVAEIAPEKIEDDWLSLPDELPLPSSAATGSDESAAADGEAVPAERFEMEMP